MFGSNSYLVIGTKGQNLAKSILLKYLGFLCLSNRSAILGRGKTSNLVLAFKDLKSIYILSSPVLLQKIVQEQHRVICLDTSTLWPINPGLFTSACSTKFRLYYLGFRGSLVSSRNLI